MSPESENGGQQRDQSQEHHGSMGQVALDCPSIYEADEISLLDLCRIIIKHRLMIGGIALTTTFAAVLVAFLMTPIYRAEVLLASPTSDQSGGGLSALIGQFGGLSSLSGVKFGDGEDKAKAIAVLKSREFTEAFIEDEKLFPILFPGEWDEDKGQWNVDKPEDIPTIRRAYTIFDQEIRSVSEDVRTGLVTLSIEWEDRVLAAAWANLLVERLNQHLQNRAIAEAEKNLEFLRAELGKTTVAELRKSIYQLVENQIEKAMLANVQNNYAFEVIDPAVVPDADMRVRPKKALIALLGFVLGLIFGVVLVFALKGKRASGVYGGG